MTTISFSEAALLRTPWVSTFRPSCSLEMSTYEAVSVRSVGSGAVILKADGFRVASAVSGVLEPQSRLAVAVIVDTPHYCKCEIDLLPNLARPQRVDEDVVIAYFRRIGTSWTGIIFGLQRFDAPCW